MEKICIVKLRKNFTTHGEDSYLRWQGEPGAEKEVVNEPRPAGASALRPHEAREREGATHGPGSGTGKRVSLTLTHDQIRTLQFDPHVASLLYESTGEALGGVEPCAGNMTLQLELPSLPPLRLLKLGEVAQMLQVSRGCLQRILQEGTLKSYKIGRLRRVMLDDLLSYLQSQQEWPSSKTTDRKSKEIPKGDDETLFEQGGLRDVL